MIAFGSPSSRHLLAEDHVIELSRTVCVRLHPLTISPRRILGARAVVQEAAEDRLAVASVAFRVEDVMVPRRVHLPRGDDGEVRHEGQKQVATVALDGRIGLLEGHALVLGAHELRPHHAEVECLDLGPAREEPVQDRELEEAMSLLRRR